MTSQEERNAKTLRKAYAEWYDTKAGRTDMWTSIVADRFTLCSVTDSALKGLDFCRVYNDREQFGDYFSAILKDWEMVYYKVDDLIAQGNRVAAVCDVSWRYKATGKTIAVKKVDIWKFDEAGRATDFFETFDTATVLAATQPG